MSEEADREYGRGADRTGMTLSAQAATVSVWLFVAALAGWTTISMADGAVALGELPAGGGSTALAWGLTGAAALALGAVVRTRDSAWRGPAALAVGLGAAFVAWSAVSIVWAPAPDRAWLATNRVGIGLAVLVLAVALTTGRRDPARTFAIGIAVAAMPVLAYALGSRVLPELLAPLEDRPRLAAPIGHANTLALVAVFVVPGAFALAATRRWRPAAGAIMAVGLLVVVLTGSRSGLLALMAALAIGVWLQPNRPALLTVLGAGIVGAVPAAIYGLTADPLTTGPFPNTLVDPSDRRGAGLVLGVLVVLGLAIAAGMDRTLAPAARRVAGWLDRPRVGRTVLAATGAAIAAGLAIAVLVGRNAEQGATRFLSVSSNNRTAWWGEAWRGFLDAPIAGHGAGSFPLTHIAERTADVVGLRVGQPHQLGLEVMSELGLVGLLLGLAALATVAWAAVRVGSGAAPALAILAAFLVQAQLDIPWTSPAATVPAMAAAGVIVAMAAPRATAGRSVAAGRLALTGLLTVAATISALVFWNGERKSTEAYLRATTDVAGAAALARTAADGAPGSIGALLVEARAHNALGRRGEATAAARRATERQPDNPFAWQCLAAVADEATRDEAVRRWTGLDPARDQARPPLCQPAW